jgi:hypothetical protein
MLSKYARGYFIKQYDAINELEKMGFGRPNNVLHAHQPKRNRFKQKARQERPSGPLSKRKVRKG